MTSATVHARTLTQSGLTNSPIFARSLVNSDQREDGERQLQAQDHLAQDEQRPVPRSP